MCTSGDVQHIGEIPLVHWGGGGGGDIMSTLGDVQHIRGISCDHMEWPSKHVTIWNGPVNM